MPGPYDDLMTPDWGMEPPEQQPPVDPMAPPPPPQPGQPAPQQDTTGLGRLASGLQDMGQQIAQPWQQAEQKFQDVVQPYQQVTSLDTEAAPGSEAALQDYGQRSLQAAEMAGQKQYSADQGQASAEAVLASKKDRIEGQALADRNALLAERDQHLSERMGKLEQLSAEIANTKIDPWKNKSTGQRMSAIGGAILGGLLLPTMGRNPAMDMMDKMMEQEIHLQETELSNKKTALSSGFNLYGLMRENYGDQLAAKDATKAAMIQQAVAQFDKQMAGVKNEQALARHLEFRSGLLAKAGELQMGAYNREAQRAATDWEHQKQRESMSLQWSGLGETRRHNKAMEGISELEMKAKAEAEKAKGAGKDLRIYGVKFKTKDAEGKDIEQDFIQAKTDNSYDKLQDVVNSGQSTLDRLADIKAIGTDGNLIRDADRAIADAAWSSIRLDMQALVKGIPSDADQRIIDLKMGLKSPQEVFTLLNKEERLRVINYLEDRTRTETNQRLKTVAGQGVSWNPPTEAVTKPPLPQEPDPPDVIRERMSSASNAVQVTPVTNKKNAYTSPFLEDARAALKADKDPASLQKTRQMVAAAAVDEAWYGRNNPDRAKLALELQKLATQIDDKIKDRKLQNTFDEAQSRSGRGGSRSR